MSLPRVSLVIMAYSPAQRPYLELLLRSVRNLDYPQGLLDVLIIAPPSYARQLEFADVNVRVREPGLGETFYASQGYNWGYENTDPQSKYILTLNDDVMLTRGSLRRLVERAEAISTDLLAINGISPCDSGLTCVLDFPVLKDGTCYVFDKQCYRLEDCQHLLPEMLNAQSAYPPGLILQPFLCMYATLFTRKLYEKIGGFAPEFHGGPDDIDFSLRTLTAGGHLFMELSAVIWHFGEVTKQTVASSDAAEWLYNIDTFRAKWGRLPPFVMDERYAAMKEAHGAR